jgi:hypothetical protein
MRGACGVLVSILVGCSGSAPPPAAPLTNASEPLQPTAGPTVTLVVVPLATFGNERSRGAYVTYAHATQVVRPLGPLARLDGAAFGTQRDYYTKIGTELVAGVETGLALFDDAPGKHVMLVLGDGNDTNNELAPAKLAALKQRAAMASIEVYAIRWSTPLSEPKHVLENLLADDGTYTPRDAKDITSSLLAIRARVRAPGP